MRKDKWWNTPKGIALAKRENDRKKLERIKDREDQHKKQIEEYGYVKHIRPPVKRDHRNTHKLSNKQITSGMKLTVIKERVLKNMMNIVNLIQEKPHTIETLNKSGLILRVDNSQASHSVINHMLVKLVNIGIIDRVVIQKKNKAGALDDYWMYKLPELSTPIDKLEFLPKLDLLLSKGYNICEHTFVGKRNRNEM